LPPTSGKTSSIDGISMTDSAPGARQRREFAPPHPDDFSRTPYASLNPRASGSIANHRRGRSAPFDLLKKRGRHFAPAVGELLRDWFGLQRRRRLGNFPHEFFRRPSASASRLQRALASEGRIHRVRTKPNFGARTFSVFRAQDSSNLMRDLQGQVSASTYFLHQPQSRRGPAHGPTRNRRVMYLGPAWSRSRKSRQLFRYAEKMPYTKMLLGAVSGPCKCSGSASEFRVKRRDFRNPINPTFGVFPSIRAARWLFDLCRREDAPKLIDGGGPAHAV